MDLGFITPPATGYHSPPVFRIRHRFKFTTHRIDSLSAPVYSVQSAISKCYSQISVPGSYIVESGVEKHSSEKKSRIAIMVSVTFFICVQLLFLR